MIIANNAGGLGNKIKNLVSCLKIAHRNRDFVKSELELDKYISFSQPWEKTKSTKNTIINDWRLGLFKSEIGNCLKKQESFISFTKQELTYEVSETNVDINFLFARSLEQGIDFQYNNISDYIIDDYLYYFNLINFSSEIIKEVNQHYNIFNNKVGVHLRSWQDDVSVHKLFYNIEIFIDEMKKHQEDFLLFTDSHEVENILTKEFGHRIIILQKFTEQKHTNLNKNALGPAIIDLLLLSKCKKIIGTYQSTFSECAWWFSKCKSEMIIPKPLLLAQI